MKISDEQFNYHQQQIRSSGRFVFAYKFTSDERKLPIDQRRARLMLHAQRCIDSYFTNMPKDKREN